ncbi:MAG: rhomboid family intramembrane serine protease [Nocardioides sp.]
MTSARTGARPRWQIAALSSVGFVALLWLIEIIDSLSDDSLQEYGVRPRSDEGLLGIAFAPLLHGDWTHIEANTVPALVLGFLVLVSGIVRGLEATGIIWLVAGIGVWLLAPGNTNHVGVSGLIFGWLVYLMVRGIWTRKVAEILLGIVLFVAYGSLLLGVLPGQPGISWQGHLFGALGGALAAWLVSFDEPARLSERGRQR